MADAAALMTKALELMNQTGTATEKDLQARVAQHEAFLAELNTALADIVAALENGTTGVTIAEAIRSLRLRVDAPTVNVTPTINVQPTPVTVENRVEPTPVTVEAILPAVPAPIVHIMPAPKAEPSVWEIRIRGQYGAPDRVMTITRKS